MQHKKLLLYFIAMGLLASTTLALVPSAGSQTDNKVNATTKFEPLQNLGAMPLAFTKNMGQWPDSILFRASANGATMWFTKNGIWYQFYRKVEKTNPSTTSIDPAVEQRDSLLRKHEHDRDSIETTMIKAEFVGASESVEVVGLEEQDYKCNYFISNDPSSWRTNVPNYSGVTLKQLYPGVDATFRTQDGSLTCEFSSISPSSLDQVGIQYRGAISIQDTNCCKVVQTILGDKTFQGVLLVGDSKATTEIESNTRKSNTSLTIIYSTFLGGSTGFDISRSIAVDGLGSVYLTGEVTSSDFPTVNAFDSSYNGGNVSGGDVFITKLSPSGNSLVYSTYLGGNTTYYGDKSDEVGRGIAVDEAGCAYVTGRTSGRDFPLVNFVGDGNLKGFNDAFVTKLSPTGDSLVYSTYLGGEDIDEGNEIAVDGAGCAFVTGLTWSFDFPVANAYDANWHYSGDAFVTKLSAGGDSLVYSTYLGGSNTEYGNGITVDADGNACVTGRVISRDFPTVNAFDGSPNGVVTAFVTKFNDSGNNLVFSTYLGGSSFDEGFDIAVDLAGYVYVAGTTSSLDFPMWSPIQGDLRGGIDYFMTKLSPDGGSLVYSTYLGGSDQEIDNSNRPIAITVDSTGCAYVTGQTRSSDFPVFAPLQANLLGPLDAFVTKLSATGGELVYSSYLGGGSYDAGTAIAVDRAGSAYVTGTTNSVDFPSLNAYEGSINGGQDIFLTRLGPLVNEIPSLSVLDGSSPARPICNWLCRIFKHPSVGSEEYVGSGTTDAAGLLAIDPLWNLQTGNPIRIEVLADRLANPRQFHEEVNGTAHNIVIDNAEVTSSSGLLVNDTYQGVPSQPITLDHATVKYNLVVAFEWDAQSSTIDNFVAGLRKVANYLYDVTDGQATLDTIAIYDAGYADRARYESADIRVEATNYMDMLAQGGTGYFQHKNGCDKALVRYPRMVYGLTKHSTIELIDQFGIDWADPGPRSSDNQSYFYPGVQAIAHELGHYLFFNFDEHNSTDPDGKRSCNEPTAGGVFGLMDEPLKNAPANPMFGEMSGEYSYVAAGSTNTTQQCIRQKSCFAFFKDLYVGGNLGSGQCWPAAPNPYVRIVTPEDRPAQDRPFIGPNNGLEEPEVNCGAAMIIKRLDTDLGNGDLDFTFKVGLPVVDARVTLRKTSGQIIEQGFTANSGRLKILGATAGDELFAVKGFPEYYSNHWPIVNARIAVTDLELIASDPTPMAIQIDALSGTQLRLRCDFDTLQSVRPFVGLWDNSSQLVSESLSVNGNSYYSTVVSSAGSDGNGYILGLDDNSHSYISMFTYQWHNATPPDVITSIVTPDYGGTFLLDSLAGVSNAVVSTCQFPAPTSGLPAEINGLSAQYGLSIYPAVPSFSGDNKIRISLDGIITDTVPPSEYSVFVWQSVSHSWEQLQSQVDWSSRNVTSTISGPGIYLAVAHGSDCCIGIRGNVNGESDQSINIVDLTQLVAYLFKGGQAPQCSEEADVNGIGSLNVADLTYLVNYLFKGGPSPVACS